MRFCSECDNMYYLMVLENTNEETGINTNELTYYCKKCGNKDNETAKNNIVVSEEKILTNQIGRIRDLKEMSDGSIIIINDEFNGGVYRLYKQ